MNRITLAFAALAATMSFSGCSVFDEPMFDEDKARAEALAKIPAKVPVERIETLELGRLYDGYMLTAYADAPGAGYYQPELRARYDGRPSADGFYEFDFIVRPPDDPAAATGAPAASRRVRGDIELPVEKLRGVNGVRVWSSRDSVEGRF